MKVPKGYRGVVLSSTDRILPNIQPAQAVEEDDDVEDFGEVKVVDEQSEFDEIMLWGHEATPDELADPYTRGMEEWIAFAEAVLSPSLCPSSYANVAFSQIHSYSNEKDGSA